jgi:hypothetical protein
MKASTTQKAFALVLACLFASAVYGQDGKV